MNVFKYTLEKELHEYIISNFNSLFDFEFVAHEYRINGGIIDIVGTDNETVYIIEVKREHATIASIKQLQSYISNFVSDKIVKGIVAAPKIDKTIDLNALPDNISIFAIPNVECGKSRIMLYVDEDMYDQIKELADKDKRSMNNYIVMLLELELERAASE
jgi:hypothetical protein